MSEIISIRAHFDGKTIVPDEPVELPENTALVVNIHAEPQGMDVEQPRREQPLMVKAKTAEERFELLRELAASMKGLPEVPLEALRRENLYNDDRY